MVIRSVLSYGVPSVSKYSVKSMFRCLAKSLMFIKSSIESHRCSAMLSMFKKSNLVTLRHLFLRLFKIVINIRTGRSITSLVNIVALTEQSTRLH